MGLAPVRLVDLDEDGWSVTFVVDDPEGLPDEPPYEPVFDEHDLEGNGDDWSAVLEGLLTEDAPEAVDTLDFDPEASMVDVSGTDLDALHTAATTLRALIDDPELLERALSIADRLELID